MAAIFEKFKPLIITLEGEKLINITGDHGGLTKYGISQAAYPNVDIANLSFEGACDIYERDFWNHYGLSRIESQEIANKVMSYLINENPYSAVRNVQRAINHCGGNVVGDGLLGARTIEAINSLPEGWLLDRIRVEGVIYYSFKVSVDKTQLEFLEGWCNRATM